MSDFECDIPEQYDAMRADCPLRNGSLCTLDDELCELVLKE